MWFAWQASVVLRPTSLAMILEYGKAPLRVPYQVGSFSTQHLLMQSTAEAQGSALEEFFSVGLQLYIIIGVAGCFLLLALILLWRNRRSKNQEEPFTATKKVSEDSIVFAKDDEPNTDVYAAPKKTLIGNKKKPGSKISIGMPKGKRRSSVEPMAMQNPNAQRQPMSPPTQLQPAPPPAQLQAAPPPTPVVSPLPPSQEDPQRRRSSAWSKHSAESLEEPDFDVEDFAMGLQEATGPEADMAGEYIDSYADDALPDDDADYYDGYEGYDDGEPEEYELGTEEYDDDLDGLVWTEGHGFLFKGDPRIGQAKDDVADLKFAVGLAEEGDEEV